MHRSGTSAVTRVISLLGLEPPHEGDLLTPRAENPKGYWESASLVAFNERILKTLGSDTGCPVALDPGWENDPRLGPLRDPARRLIADVFPKAPWVFKDPRLSLTFGFWRAVLNVRPVVVLVSRNPLEILVSRLGEEREDEKIYLLAVWERYLRRALTQIVGLPVFVTTYTALLGAPLRWCEQMASFLTGAGIDAPLPAENDAVQGEALRFVDRGLRHSEFARADFLAHPDVSGAQGQLLCALEDLQGPHESFIVPALPEETPTTSALLRERHRTLLIRQELRGLEAERHRRWHRRLRNSRYGDAARPIYVSLRRLMQQ
jgi:hypothetical protein